MANLRELSALLQTEEDLAALHARLRVRFDLDTMGSAFHPMNEVAEAVDKLRWKVYESRAQEEKARQFQDHLE